MTTGVTVLTGMLSRAAAGAGRGSATGWRSFFLADTTGAARGARRVFVDRDLPERRFVTFLPVSAGRLNEHPTQSSALVDAGMQDGAAPACVTAPATTARMNRMTPTSAPAAM